MWWWLEKTRDSDEYADYEYGIATQSTSGKIRIIKNNNEVELVKMADGDSDALYQVFYRLVRYIIADAGFPEVRSIATG